MKISRILILSLWSFFVCAQEPASELHTWRSTSGHSREAAFLRVDGVNVVLADGAGGELVIALALLDEASRNRAVELQGAGAGARGARGPVSLFVHRGDSYELRVSEGDRWGQLFVREANGALSRTPPMILASYSAYTQGKEQTKLRFVSIKEPPVLVDNAVQWTMVLDYGVERTIRIELGKDELRLSHTQTKGSVPAPDSILHAISVNFPAVVEFDVESRMYKGPALPQGVSQAGLKTALQGHQLLMRTDGSRRSTLYPFSDITPTPYIGMVDAAEVKGMYAPFRIEYTDAETTATSGFYSYGGQPPSSGFKISHSKIDAAAPLATGVFSLSIRR